MENIDNIRISVLLVGCILGLKIYDAWSKRGKGLNSNFFCGGAVDVFWGMTQYNLTGMCEI
jgi:hypothetical protein